MSDEQLFTILNDIKPYKDKQKRCGKVYEVIKDCKTLKEAMEAIRKAFGEPLTDVKPHSL